MKIALAQLDPTVGDLDGNAERILAAAGRAAASGARLAVFGELCLPGYPPLDLLERPAFLDACEAALARVVAELPEGLVAVVGTVARSPGRPGLRNVAVAARRGEVLCTTAKRLLPTYDVFDEARWFEPGPAEQPAVLELDGRRLGLTVCEDLWNDAEFWPSRRYTDDPAAELAGRCDLLLNLSSSPWSADKGDLRARMLAHSARRHGVWVLYTNQVGGNDGLLFDGESLAVSPEGRVVARGARFAEDLVLVDLDAPGAAVPAPARPRIADVHDALVMGIRDYFAKLRFRTAVVALSGGIDSAVTAELAVAALGAENVTGLGLPSRYSSEGSVTDARVLAERLGIAFHVVEIEPMFAAYLAQLGPVFGDRPPDVTEENLQSRIRGALVMAYSNKTGAVVLTTGNKSECAVGYATMYGDTCGGLAPLADCYKHQVYALARWANRDGERIPESTITKPPSAELRPDQKDSDSLPDYDLLDEILRRYLEQREGAAEIAAATGAAPELVESLIRKVYAAEYKRKQFPPTLRISEKAWVGRVYPLAHRFRG